MQTEDLKKYAKSNFVPIILDDSREFLEKTCKELDAKEILEIGTAIGYSGIILLNSCPKAHLTTIEKNEVSYKKAQETFKLENVEERVTSILGDAGEVIKNLDKKYDLIFLDGPKGQYIYYLPTLLNLLAEGGTLIADNVYFKGMVMSSEYPKHKHRTIVMNLRKFLNEISTNKCLNTIVYDIGDGISVSKKLY